MLEERYLELGSRLIDGDLGSQEEELLLREMERNPELRREIEIMEDLRRSVRRASLADRPPEMMDTLMENFRRSHPPQRRLSLALPLLAAAALISIAFLLIHEVGKTPLRPKKISHQLFALANPPSRPDDAPLGPLDELLAEDLEEPVLNIPHALLAQGPLPAPPPTSKQGCVLESRNYHIPLAGVRPRPGIPLRIEMTDGIVVGCESRSESACTDLLGRRLSELPDGKLTVRLKPSAQQFSGMMTPRTFMPERRQKTVGYRNTGRPLQPA